MADQHSGEATKGVGEADPRQHNETSTGRGESGSAPDASRRGVVQPSTSGSRASN
ncbi:MAG TPA: hypothetical protein VHU89_02000 [Acidobacteriaceae bacterium]|jgi:hypothetical protein|nr:hypothetical protein [Acidobacteriaceae bacterium]